jgi:hypothetical protein
MILTFCTCPVVSKICLRTSSVKGSLVGLRGGAPDGAAGAHGRAKTVQAVGIRHVHGERIVVLGDVQAERRLSRHALAVAILIARHTTHGGRHGELLLLLGGTVVVGHYDGVSGVRREKEVEIEVRRR